jgi:hypothetical protein
MNIDGHMLIYDHQLALIYVSTGTYHVGALNHATSIYALSRKRFMWLITTDFHIFIFL